MECDYYESGKLKNLTVYEYGNTRSAKDYDENQPANKMNTFTDGKKQGLWKEYLDEKDSVTQDTAKANYYRVSNYVDGLPDGLVKIYFRNGNIFRELPYVDGLIRGFAEWYYKTGELQEEAVFIDGKKDGPAIAFYKNGMVSRKAIYTSGLLNRNDEKYYPNGRLMSVTLYSNNTKASTTNYDENGDEVKK